MKYVIMLAAQRHLNNIRNDYKYSKIIFFFQAEDGIRDYKVTGVQTCALPICSAPPTIWGARRPRAGRWTRWRAFTWATARAWSGSTGRPTSRPRDSSSRWG